MRNVARLPDNDRGELFRNTADKMGLNDAIVEKDFWVCFTLDHLFHRCPWKDAITFKGGTSLSKAFNLISRFSEDIDLILDWRVLGYGKDEPWEKRSNTKQDAFNKEANARAEVFLAEQFCPTVQAEFSRELGCEANIYIDEKEKQIGAGHASLEQLMLYQELLYRIEVLYASQAFCQTAPVTTDVAVLSGHYQLVDAYIQCLTKERRLGQPADQNLKAKRQTASETLDKVVLDCRKRFSSFTPTDQNQYRKGVSSLINTVLPVWLKLRNTYINISK